MRHNAEIDACDLAMEIERLDLLEEYVDKNTYNRVCLYLTRYPTSVSLQTHVTPAFLCFNSKLLKVVGEISLTS